MTVSSTETTKTFYGNGSSGPFTFGFRFLTNADIVINKLDIQSVRRTLIEGSHYTLSGGGGYAGGTISLVNPLNTGEKLYVERAVPAVQSVDFRNQGGYLPEVLETAIDKLTMLFQQSSRIMADVLYAGTGATADPQYFLNLLTNSISTSTLDDSLTNRIDLIDTPSTGLVDQLVSVNNGLSSIQTQINSLTVADFNADVNYSINDLVRYSGLTYKCISPTLAPSPLPTNASYWVTVADTSSLATMLSDETSARIEGDAATVGALETIQATADGNTVAIATEQSVRAVAVGPNYSSAATYLANRTVLYGNGLYQNKTGASIGPEVWTPAHWTPITANLYAQYTVKTDVNGKVAGYGLANDGIASVFEIVADRVAVCNNSGTGTVYPFIIDSGVVIIDNGVIKNLTSTNIAANSISASSIKTSELVVGTNIAMGAGARLAWSQVTSQPTIPDDAHITTITQNTVTTTFVNALDVQASSLKANTVMVNTANIAGQAVTFPLYTSTYGLAAEVLSFGYLNYLQQSAVVTSSTQIGGTFSGATVVIDVQFKAMVYDEVGGEGHQTLTVRLVRVNAVGTETTLCTWSSVEGISLWIDRPVNDACPAGYNTYQLKASFYNIDQGNNLSLHLTDIAIRTLEVKK